MNVNVRSVLRTLALAALLLAPAAAAYAQGAGTAPAAAPSKVGILNVRQAIVKIGRAHV